MLTRQIQKGKFISIFSPRKTEHTNTLVFSDGFILRRLADRLEFMVPLEERVERLK